VNVGIDLGTTNSALAYIDPKEAAEADYPSIQVLDVPQTVAQGRVEARRTLPSFVYLGDQESHKGRMPASYATRVGKALRTQFGGGHGVGCTGRIR